MASEKKRDVVRKQAGSGRRHRVKSHEIKKLTNPSQQLLDEIGILQIEVRQLHADYLKARKRGNGAVDETFKRYCAGVDHLRRLSVSSPGASLALSQVVEREVVAEEWAKLTGEYIHALDALAVSLPPRLLGLDEGEMQAEIQKTTDRLRRELKTRIEKWKS